MGHCISLFHRSQIAKADIGAQVLQPTRSFDYAWLRQYFALPRILQ